MLWMSETPALLAHTGGRGEIGARAVRLTRGHAVIVSEAG